ncbi:MAG TPA: S9 family peptidase [Vitreimonas sp.]|nr:S9 family peptidase [Vitreimonas sp.]
MTARHTGPYGSWRSPFPIDVLVSGRVSLGEARFDGPDALVWIETRPEDAGRQTLVRWTQGEGPRDISPAGMNVRSRVHEYGGAPSLVSDDLVVVSDFATGRLHRVAPDRSSEPLTPEVAWRFADLALDPRRQRLLAIREDHTGEGEAVNAIVAVPLDGSADTRILAEGRTFYAAPRLSPDGTRLAFLAWDHPNMPWDGMELFLASVEPDGGLSEPRRVAGSASDWVTQPRWSPDGSLHFVAEPSGWMNLQRLRDAIEPVTDLDAEFAYPDWVFGQQQYAFAPDGSILAIGRSRTRDRLYRIAAEGGEPELIDLPFTELDRVDVAGHQAVLAGGGPTTFNAIVLLDLRDGSHRIVRRSSTMDVDPATISVPEPVEFPTTGGRTAFGLYYPPTNQEWGGREGERPPLVVTSHGGPTAQASSRLSMGTQLFTSRGFAVLDVDYGGSTGYGREYRKRLEGQWGIVDVDDCVAGARHLAERGDVDGDRLAIRGGSASGYTTLCALAFRDDFSAGVSYFGIGDLLAFVRETHKFESRYLDRLVGPLPEAESVYRERSPNNYAHQITCPVLILQGKDDQIVPLAEAERCVDALWERRIPHGYIAFDGEDHGFRKADSIIRSFEAELSFLAQVFGFEPADEIEPVHVEGLDAWRAAQEPVVPSADTSPKGAR